MTGIYSTAAGRWAGVGPYYAMFPISFATDAIREHTVVGDCVFDPFAGRSTTLFSAASEGRMGVGIEINPVGWVYGKAKLRTARRTEVEDRMVALGKQATRYRNRAKELPFFFKRAYCLDVRAFLLAARDLLDWRRNRTDWTTMALLLVDLHGKRDSALSNQMRQTKGMSPRYAIQWWRENGQDPPRRNPVDFMLKKVEWRYAKGRLDAGESQVYLGDNRTIMSRWASLEGTPKATLLLTSPPYFRVADYFYDQWLRLWLLGGAGEPSTIAHSCKGKFGNQEKYETLLRNVFEASKKHLKRGAVIKVRTDTREVTRNATVTALELAFPRKKIRVEQRSTPAFTQTSLFDPGFSANGEIDYVMW